MQSVLVKINYIYNYLIYFIAKKTSSILMNIDSTNSLHTLLIPGWALKSRQIYGKGGRGKGFGDTVRQLLKDMYAEGIDNISNRLNSEEMLEILQEAKDSGTIPYDEELPKIKQI